jgi:hypothetical protein
VKINVSEAVVKTAEVQVHVLTISGKQVTLAVFRQLEESPLLSDAHDLRGPAWGRVNYHPDGCKGDGEHMHVVWQDGTELRRSRVRPPDRLDRTYIADDDRWLYLAIRRGWRPRLEWSPWRADPRYGAREPSDLVVRNKAGRPIQFIICDDALADALQDDKCYGYRSGSPGWCGAEERHQAHWKGDDLCADFGSEEDLDSLWRDLIRADQEEQALHQKAVDQYAALAALPQLFIAV